MRAFWFLIGALLLAGVVYGIVGLGGERTRSVAATPIVEPPPAREAAPEPKSEPKATPPAAVAPASQPTPKAAQTTPVEPPKAPVAQPTAQPVAEVGTHAAPAPAAAPEPVKENPIVAAPEVAPKAASPASEPAAKPEPVKPEPAKPEPAKPAAAAAPKSEPVSVAVPAAPVAKTPDAPKATSTTPPTTPTAAPAAATATATDAKPAASDGSVQKIGAYEVSPGKIEKKPDGSMLLDDKYVVKGEGTKEKPYEITWELLTSVDQAFDPHAGKNKIPQRIAMLQDKYVKFGGYIAFPMNMQQPKELLLMLNQWDGCCIGVPPTPYDAIEVTLNKSVTGEDRFSTTGSVVGKMGIKPYVVGDWLVGLYIMDSGEFSPKFGGSGNS